MGLRKWTMKQYWRLLQVRGIWGLFYGVLLLAVAYYTYIPFFVEMGTLGPFALAACMLFVFLILGYLYDRVFVLWSPQQEVVRERDPFQYVPNPRDRIFWFPIYSVILSTLESLAQEFDVDRTAITDTREYFAELQNMRPERREDIDNAIALRKKFVEAHPFSRIANDDNE